MRNGLASTSSAIAENNNDNNNGNTDRSNSFTAEETAVEMIRCNDCGHSVPQPNMALHRATRCGARAGHNRRRDGASTSERRSCNAHAGVVAAETPSVGVVEPSAPPCMDESESVVSTAMPSSTWWNSWSGPSNSNEAARTATSTATTTTTAATPRRNSSSLAAAMVEGYHRAVSSTLNRNSNRDGAGRTTRNDYINERGAESRETITTSSTPGRNTTNDNNNNNGRRSSSSSWATFTNPSRFEGLRQRRRTTSSQTNGSTDTANDSSNSNNDDHDVVMHDVDDISGTTGATTTATTNLFKTEEEGQEVIDLTGGTERQEQHENAMEIDDEEEERGGGGGEWACPRCTLLNPSNQIRCDACHYMNNHVNNNSNAGGRETTTGTRGRTELEGGVRAPDQTRRERLVNDDLAEAERAAHAFEEADAAALRYAYRPIIPDGTHGQQQQQQRASSSSSSSSSASFVGGGALLGSLFGAANAYVRGRSMGNGALEGALSGAVGGALMGEVLRDVAPPDSTSGSYSAAASPPYDSIAAARSSASMGLPGYPGSGRSSSSSSSRMQPRRSVRVIRRPDGQGGFTTTTITSSSFGGGGGTPMVVGGDAAVIDMLLQSMILGGGGHLVHGGGRGVHGARGDIDGMSYERLLELFGDGTENRGADAATINSLPTSTITNVDKELPEDLRKCSICLEKFQTGDKRRTLPCLHGFHEKCVDRWLRTNASCPVCKHPIAE